MTWKLLKKDFFKACLLSMELSGRASRQESGEDSMATGKYMILVRSSLSAASMAEEYRHNQRFASAFMSYLSMPVGLDEAG